MGIPTKKNRPRKDPLWHAQVAVLVALILQVLLPDVLVAGPRFVLPILEGLLLVGLSITTKRVPIFGFITRRINALALIALVSVANIYSLERLVHFLLLGSKISSGHQLIVAAINIYLTNIIIFGLWYWEMDGGGPGERKSQLENEKDFLFPQTTFPHLAAKDWFPAFVDYLYVSVTNAMAFSPTDTMPLTHRAKLLMSAQAFVSLVTIALVAARAVNILG